MYRVGNQTFNTIQEARAYDYATNGTIDNVQSVAAPSLVSDPGYSGPSLVSDPGYSGPSLVSDPGYSGPSLVSDPGFSGRLQ